MAGIVNTLLNNTHLAGIFWCVFSILFHNIRGQTKKYLGDGDKIRKAERTSA